jgi:hypothetical protein
MFENTIIHDILSKNMVYKVVFNTQENINPCFQHGFEIVILNKTIQGNGNSFKCYEILKKIIPQPKPYMKNIRQIPEIFEIMENLNIRNLTFGELPGFAKEFCSMNYTRNSDSTCMKLVYIIILTEDLGIKNVPIIPTGEQVKEDYKFDFTYGIVGLYLIYIFSYVYKDELTEYTELLILREKLTFEKLNYTVLLSILNTVPMKKYLLRNHIEDLTYSSKDIFYNYSKYIHIFANLAKTNKQIISEINQTLQFKNSLKCSILISKFQIVLCIILSLLTYQFLNEFNFSDFTQKVIITTASYIFMLIAILESLKLIETTDIYKSQFTSSEVGNNDN